MLTRLLLVVFVSSLFAMDAAGATVVGTVLKVDPTMIQVRTDDGQTTSVTLSASTQYRKWIMAKPLQQDPRADLRFVQVGKRVRIEVMRDDPMTARVVWIVTR